MFLQFPYLGSALGESDCVLIVNEEYVNDIEENSRQLQQIDNKEGDNWQDGDKVQTDFVSAVENKDPFSVTNNQVVDSNPVTMDNLDNVEHEPLCPNSISIPFHMGLYGLEVM